MIDPTATEKGTPVHVVPRPGYPGWDGEYAGQHEDGRALVKKTGMWTHPHTSPVPVPVEDVVRR